MARRRVSDPKVFGRVAVLMGGWSAERQVSLWSGQGVFEALRDRGVDVTAVDADKATVLNLGSQGYDRVFNIMHGTGGEDGTVQAILDLHGLPYPGSGVLASALAMDKLRTKRIWKAEGLPTPDFAVLNDVRDAHEAARRFGFPFIIKPAADGSSVGVSKVKQAAQIEQAFAEARGDGRTVIAEQFIAGGEYTCPVLDGEALPVIRIEPDGEFYDYHAKYISNNTRYHCPAGLAPEHERRLQSICARAFELIGCEDWGRVDFMMDAQGQPWLLEINTLPGMTSHSLVPMAAKARGMSYADLCWALLETTLGSGDGG
ncbi:MAG: D-alanine--D-alanine ligase [Nevskiaceae bacterium]|nr:MAG: D-alanine--D-alanine ligase [Nevskiaceae bacterium]